MEYIQAKRLLEQALENQKTIQIEKLKSILDVLERNRNVDILKRKNGVPSVISFQGNRYIRDVQNKLHTHKFKAK